MSEQQETSGKTEENKELTEMEMAQKIIERDAKTIMKEARRNNFFKYLVHQFKTHPKRMMMYSAFAFLILLGGFLLMSDSDSPAEDSSALLFEDNGGSGGNNRGGYQSKIRGTAGGGGGGGGGGGSGGSADDFDNFFYLEGERTGVGVVLNWHRYGLSDFKNYIILRSEDNSYPNIYEDRVLETIRAQNTLKYVDKSAPTNSTVYYQVIVETESGGYIYYNAIEM